ncbi:response regulator [Cohnella sp.]|uniref:response regulator transcription factor n=1 Tax=Cohnella sp. TaxID=1883426 RepID=UPI00356A604E
MHLLIADDDDYTRIGLMESIDWKKYGISDIKQAKDGAEALRIALWFQPDIVLTDIRMPKLSGIEFAEQLAEKCGECKLLFMSGYLDTAYLKSAIKLAAVDYIEKPIKLPELEAAIQRSVEFIDDKQKNHVLNDQRMDLQRQKLAGMLKQKNNNLDDLLRLCNETGFPTDMNYICLVAWHKSVAESQEMELAALQSFWKANSVPAVCVSLEENHYLSVLALKKQETKRIKSLIQSFLQQNEDFYMGAGIEANSFALVPESYQSAMTARGRSFYNPNIRFFYTEEKKNVPQGVNTDLYPEFFNLLKNEPKKLTSWFDTVCDGFCEMEYPRKERVGALFTSFAQAMLREKSTVLSRIDSLYSLGELERYIQNCDSIISMKQLVSQILTAYLEEVESSSKYSRVVRDVMDYIASHYCKLDLDLREIADHVHLSAAHLGTLFKQETGITIKQYIADYRLDLAKKLISNEHYKINAISEQCGYASASYFTKVFKEATEVTPVEYRKMIMK